MMGFLNLKKKKKNLKSINYFNSSLRAFTLYFPNPTPSDDVHVQIKKKGALGNYIQLILFVVVLSLKLTKLKKSN